MAKKTLVESLRKMSSSIIRDKKNVSLIMLLGNGNNEETDSFDYVISAKWLDEKSQEEGMDIILDYVFTLLTVEERKHISRVTIIHTMDPIVRSITTNVEFSNVISEMINCQFGNMMIPYAFIFESHG